METWNLKLSNQGPKGLSDSFKSNYLIHPFLAQFIMRPYLEFYILKPGYPEKKHPNSDLVFYSPFLSQQTAGSIHALSILVVVLLFILLKLHCLNKTDISTNLPVSFSSKMNSRQFLTNSFESNSISPEAKTSICKYFQVYQELLSKRVPRLMD